MGQSKRNRLVKTVCKMCGARCGIDVYLRNGEVAKITGMREHPRNTLCIKARAMPEMVHSSERLTAPLKKVGGEFKQVSWDEALDFIADKLTSIKEKYGAKAVVLHAGHLEQTTKVVRRFGNLYGTPNYTSPGSFCIAATVMGHGLTLGADIFSHCSPNTQCMVVWGSNPEESHPVRARAIKDAVKSGARLIVIDPRATPMARKADIHAQIRPGTDCALALGLLHVIIGEGLYDRDFVNKWTVGFDRLVERVKEYSPERVERITRVPAKTIVDAARIYATTKPAAIDMGISLNHCTNGIQTIRAIDTLIAITGNLDVDGGNIFLPRLALANLGLGEKALDDIAVGTGYPLYTRYFREQTVVPVIDQILTEEPYAVKALLVAGANPALTWPNTNKVLKARAKLDLLLVVDIFMTETARMADIVLPGTTFLEREDLRDYRPQGLSLITLTNRAIEPVGNAMEDWKIWAELGRRMGYAEYFPWKDAGELFAYLLKPTGISPDQLRKNPGGMYYAQREPRKYLRDGFTTPSGKVEIYSKTMDELGYDPIPTFHEPLESLVSQSSLAGEYPLILTTGPRTINYYHSQFRNLPSLRKLEPEPLIAINPQTAASFGIADRDLVRVESPRGGIEIKASITEDIHPGVVSLQHGWEEANVNLLTDDMANDPISSCPGFRSVFCRVLKSSA
ncbi:molybdopterin-dependent oxidoreductase [Chloroflexota bacterium]